MLDDEDWIPEKVPLMEGSLGGALHEKYLDIESGEDRFTWDSHTWRRVCSDAITKQPALRVDAASTQPICTVVVVTMLKLKFAQVGIDSA
eukprot:4744719-Amphidinium_carterae.1